MPEDTGTVEGDAPQAPEGDPQVEAPATESTDSQTQEQIDYEKRYNDLRPEADRQRNLVQQYEQVFQDPSTLARAIKATGLSEAELLQELGYQTEGQDDIEDVDPIEQKLEGIEQWVQSEQQAREEQELADLEVQYFDQEISRIESSEGKQLSEEDIQDLVALAQAMPDDQGLPNVEAAYKRMSERTEARHKAYLETKKAPSVPVGPAGSEAIDLSDDDKRQEYAMRVAQAALDSE